MKKTIKWLLISFISLLVIVLLFFFWIFRYNASTMQENMIHATQKQLDHASYLLAAEVKEAELNAMSVISNQQIRFFETDLPEDLWDPLYTENYSQVRNTLLDQVENSEGIESLTVYWKESETIISSNAAIVDSQEFYSSLPKNGWFSDNNRLFFVTSFPYVYLPKAKAGTPQYYAVVELSRYHLEEIRQLTANTDNSRSLLLMPDETSITAETKMDKKAIRAMRQDGAFSVSDKHGEFTIDDETYYYFTEENSKAQLRLITYLPFSPMTAAVARIARITVTVALVVLVIAIVIALLFYTNISVQVKRLVQKFKQVENGDYNTRITEIPNNEFGYVFDQFNQMVIGGQKLLESLSSEQRSRDAAEFKQLQFQINPHFLYNSLAYIVSISYDQEAVTNMAAHLADYYRYSTKSRVATTIGDEAKFAESYLEIMAMRKNLDYQLVVADSLKEEKILPLLLQPLIENAIEHGIEGKEGAYQIRVSVVERDDKIRIAVADDGYGLSRPEIRQLTDDLRKKERGEGVSVGLWNVHQRLLNRYGYDSALHFSRSQLGGLEVYFEIPKALEEPK